MKTQSIHSEPLDHPAEVAILEEPRGLVVRILAGITLRNAAEIRSAVVAAWQERPRPPKVVLDLEGVHHIDSTGVGTLLDLAQKARIAGIPFILCGLERGPWRVLRRTKLAAQFQISQSVEDALGGSTIAPGKDSGLPMPWGRVDKPVRGRSHRGLWLAIAFILLVLAAGGAYGYWAVETYRGRSSLLPAMEGQLAGVGQRIDAAETSLRGWTKQREALGQRITNVESRLGRTLQAARKEAQDITARAQNDMQAMVDKRTAALETSLGAVQAAQQSEDIHIANLQQQFDQTKAANVQEIAQLHDQMAQQQTAERDDIAALDSRIASAGGQAGQNNVAMAAGHNGVDRERVDFELGVNRNRELAPGISLNVDRTDTQHQQFSGRVWVTPDRHNLWIRGQGIEQPLVFYTGSDDRPRELVITRITSSSVAGYLLVPRDTAPNGALTGPKPSTH